MFSSMIGRFAQEKKPPNPNKIFLVGGYVRSIRDGQSHFVSANKLIDLYRLRDFKSAVVTCSGHDDALYYLQSRSNVGDCFLYPDTDGDYRLPKAALTIIGEHYGTNIAELLAE